MSESIREVRLKKLAELRARGVNPYPDRFERTHTLAETRAAAAPLELAAGAPARADAPAMRLCGRLMAFRDMGKLTFGKIADFSGELQIALNQAVLGKETYDTFQRFFDVGDFLGVEGRLFVTRRGELTLDVARFELLGKAIRPLPEKWHGLQDQELRWRHRYLDLVMNPETRARFRLRSQIVRVMRELLDQSGFEEVETPVLMPHASGAMARPFVAHHNSLDLDVFLRIAPETYLKRLIVGGYDRVYEFARCFRNEGLDPSHLQDFTMLEGYAAYWNFVDNMDFTERLVQHTLEKVKSSLRVEFGGKATDFSGAWPRRTLRKLIIEDSGIDIDRHPDADALRGAIREQGIRLEDAEKLGRGNLIDALYKKVSRPKIANPIFVTSHPADLSPLARRNDVNPAQVDRFQLVVHGWSTPSTSGRASTSRRRRGRRATRRPWSWRRITSSPWSTACRRSRASAWGSTASSRSSAGRRTSATSCSSRSCGRRRCRARRRPAREPRGGKSRRPRGGRDRRGPGRPPRRGRGRLGARGRLDRREDREPSDLRR